MSRKGRGGGGRKVKRLRREAWVRQCGRCIWCDAEVPEAYATAEHVINYCQGGPTDETNIAMACHDCNNTRARANDYGRLECLT
jgi:5-methylcytosine-specific restriction endonuclease McrA